MYRELSSKKKGVICFGEIIFESNNSTKNYSHYVPRY